jgi:hypothetical protein
MPRNSQMPELPQPVPISTTARAAIALAKNLSAAPVAGVTGSVPPRSVALARAVSSGSSSTAYSASSYSMTIPLRDACPLVSLANFAGPWNLKVTLSVTQSMSEPCFRVA